MAEITSNLLNDVEFKAVKQSIIDASEDDKYQDFRVDTVEFINDASYDNDDQFFYEMLEFLRFYDYEHPKRLKKAIAYTKPDKRIYMNCPEGGGVGEKLKKWEFIYDHECLHQLWDTFGVEKDIKAAGLEFDHNILNIASDCIINHYLRDFRNKTPFENGIFPETIEKETGVKYDYKYDDQFSLYVKLLENREKLKKLIPLQIKDEAAPPTPPSPPPPPNGGYSDDYKRGWSDAIDDVIHGKVDPLKYNPKTPKNDYEQGYEDAMGQMKEGLESGITIPKSQGGASGQQDKDGLRQIPWDIPPEDDDDDGDGGSSGDSESSSDSSNNKSGKKGKPGNDGKSGDSDDDSNNDSGDASDNTSSSDKGGDTAKDAQKAANEAADDAKKAQDAADEAKAKGSKDAKQKQKNADDAKKAAKEAQDAADAAQDAADDADKDGEEAAAKKAKDAAKKAKEAASKNGVDSSGGGDDKSGESDDSWDDDSDGEFTGKESTKGGKGSNKKPSPESAADIKKITEKAGKVLEKYSNVISGALGEFCEKCRSAKKLNKGGLQIGAAKAAKGWDAKMYDVTMAYVRQNISKKRREFKKSYRRLPRRNSQVAKFGEFILPGKEVKKNALTINAAFYVDNSTSMSCGDRIGNVWKAAYEICEALKRKFANNKIVDDVTFKMHYFNDYVHEIKYGQKTGVDGCTMEFAELVEQIIKRSNDYLINIIITDAGFNSVDYNKAKEFMKNVNGMVNFITVEDNYTIKKLEKDYPKKFFYILAKDNFKLSDASTKSNK